MKFSFIVIDDRELDCFIAEKMIEKSGLSKDVRCFNEPKLALEAIAGEKSADHAVILLDIMMPVMNGFDFMEEFEKFDENIKQKYRIVAITTSLNKNDISRINEFNSVFAVLKKPYTIEDLVKLLDA